MLDLQQTKMNIQKRCRGMNGRSFMNTCSIRSYRRFLKAHKPASYLFWVAQLYASYMEIAVFQKISILTILV